MSLPVFKGKIFILVFYSKLDFHSKKRKKKKLDKNN